MITLVNLSFAYEGGTRPVFDGVSAAFNDGRWTAVIGPNGSGKSTLVKLITGALRPDAGTVRTGGTVVVCPQTSEEPPPCFRDPEILNRPEFFALLGRLDIGGDWAERWDTLSGGERKRCVLADALIRKPAALILDEPANHIDEPTQTLLTAALRPFEGAGIVISHNRAFLDALASETLLLTPRPGGAARVWACAAPPETALAEFERDRTGARERRERLERDVRALDRGRREAVERARADVARRMSKKRLAPGDSDGRAKVNLARLSGRDAVGGKRVARLETELARKRTELDAGEPVGLRKTGAGLRGTRSARPVLYYEGPGEIRAGGYTVAHPGLEIPNDARIAVSGPNGSGKTTVVEHIARNLSGVAFWYQTQEQSAGERAALREALLALDERRRGDALSVIYRLGSEPEAVLGTRDLSPGEARKLAYALALLRGVSLVILDEPTNHMDAVSAGALAEALGEFAGAVVIVSHDRVFAGRVAEVEWRLERAGGAGGGAERAALVPSPWASP